MLTFDDADTVGSELTVSEREVDTEYPAASVTVRSIVYEPAEENVTLISWAEYAFPSAVQE